MTPDEEQKVVQLLSSYVSKDKTNINTKQKQTMEEIIKYKCDICGYEHDTKEKCEKCQQTHQTPRDIISWDFDLSAKPFTVEAMYPRTILVYMHNGTVETYVRKDIAYCSRRNYK